MNRRLLFLVFPLLVPLVVVGLLLTMTQGASLAQPAEVDMSRGVVDETGWVSVIVELTGRADFTTLPLEKETRHMAVIDRLQQVAQESQADLLLELDALQNAGTVLRYRPFWIVNGVAVTAEQAVIDELATRPGVANIIVDETIEADLPETVPAGASGSRPWGIERVRAPQVWGGLGVDGAGVVVANMDTGVDWLHPDLAANYRGQGTGTHVGHWFDASSNGYGVPTDQEGHGTHVMGTLAGQNGIGVAPGAQWVAVRIFNDDNLATLSGIHAAFEWLLAPAGDPALAPDVVNGSWGNASGSLDFVDDVAALEAAGIVPVFSAGNSGPEGTVGSPGSYADVLTAAASDRRETIAWFSSVGPSPFTDQIKPMIAAPGARVLSAVAGGGYGFKNGTSMAAPHVAGAAALLLSADPTLGRASLTEILTSSVSTANFAEPLPNFVAGWGRLDVYGAVSGVVDTGRVTGVLVGVDGPLVGQVVTITTPLGEALPFVTDELGRYGADLLPGSYGVEAAVFGYAPVQVAGVAIVLGDVTVQDLGLTLLASGTVTGQVQEVGSLVPIEARVHVVGRPITVTASTGAGFELLLPAGAYDLKVTHTGHDVAYVAVVVPADGSVPVTVNLAPRERVLLVDSGHWYYNPQGAYYRASLEDLDYSFDEWRVYRPSDAPTGDDLLDYDRVVWSAPFDAPALINASLAISRFVGLGGDLFISGQNIALYDGFLGNAFWWRNQLQGAAEGQLNPAGTMTVTGQGVFGGLAFTLNGADSAQNQAGFDFVRPLDGSFTEEGLQYADGKGAGLLAGHCAAGPFHIAYLGFGLEGVTDRANRTAVLGRSFDYFATPPRPAGVSLSSDVIDNLVFAGQTVTYTLTIVNEGELVTDTMALEAVGNVWPVSFVTPTLTVGACGTLETQMVIEVPAGLPRDTVHAFDVRVSSLVDPSQMDVVGVVQKTPGRVLLVDDDLFYDQELLYRSALDELGVAYDVWDTDWKGGFDRNPPAGLLSQYDMVLWYTGYDWFRPISTVQADALHDYVAGGGRLFLSSQDFLYYNAKHPLARDFLGVLDYQESITPTVVFGGDNALVGELASQPLTYAPYLNFSDGLVPSPEGEVFVWHNGGGAGGVARTEEGAWRTLFWSVPLEKLPLESHVAAMNGVVGWLSDVGGSSLVSERRVVELGEWDTYTLTVRHEGDGLPGRVAVTNTLPAELRVMVGSITGDGVYDFASHSISWAGDVAHGGTHVITYEALVVGDTRPGMRLDNRAVFYEERHDFHFEQVAPVWVAVPDVVGSVVSVTPLVLRPGRATTVTAVLHNSGAVSGTVSGTVHLPFQLTPLSTTLTSSAGLAVLDGFDVRWVGGLEPGRGVTISLVLTAPFRAMPRWLPVTLVVNDEFTYPLVRQAVVEWVPFTTYYPLIAKQE